MAVRILPNGTVEFDTVADAVDYQQQVQGRAPAPVVAAVATPKPRRVNQWPTPVASGDPIYAAISSAEGNVRKVIDAICGTPETLTTDDLAEKCGLKGTLSVGPLIRFVNAQFNNCGVKPEKVFRREKFRNAEKKLTYRYTSTVEGRVAWAKVSADEV